MHARASQVAQTVKNLPVVQETQVQSLGQEDPLQKGMTTHLSILAWRIKRREEPGGYSPWGHKELKMTEQLTDTHITRIICSNSMKNILGI